MKYEGRVVAFIDILGFKAAVDKSATNQKEFDKIYNTLKELQEFFLKPKDEHEKRADKYLQADTKIIQISDSLIISRLIQEQGGIFYMLQDCAFAIHLLISKGFLCRGAIKFGYMFHTDTMIFGDAYVRAYLAEEEEALPIVKFDAELLEIVKHFPGPANKGYEKWELDFIKKNIKKLPTGEYYLDYFTDYDDRVGGDEGSSSIHYDDLREIILEGLKLPIGSSAFKKHKWAAEQFNLTANDYGLAVIPIP